MLRAVAIAHAAVFVISSSGATALTLNVDANGILIGAFGVLVEGTAAYDVEFLEGSCDEVYSGCNELYPGIDHLLAQALLDQVFVGQFDSDPTLTRGCTDSGSCRALVPRMVRPEDGAVLSSAAINWAPGHPGFIDHVNASPGVSWSGNDTAGDPSFTLARFTVVPEPGTMLLVGLGLIGLGGCGRSGGPMRHVQSDRKRAARA
jgi:hypothetical protein